MGVELSFTASLRALGEERSATFYLMDTDLNRNNWRVTEEALRTALPGLRGRPLGCIPGYRVNHTHRPLVVGRWVGGEMQGGRALATAEITDKVAWDKVERREWGPVSVVIRAERVTCSTCGRDITEAPDDHILEGGAHEVVERFSFDRVDFVSEPAYPQAGLRSIRSSRSTMDGAQGPRDEVPKPEEKKEKNRMEQKIAQLEHQLETVKAENRELRAERRRKFMERAIEARARAGITRDRKAEAEHLDGFQDEVLVFLAEDAERLSRASPSLAPKARYAASRSGALDEAVEEMRVRLFGHRRES
ncbi:MAG: septum formation initiator family protein [Candidatus Bathyarchaeota archaeon]